MHHLARHCVACFLTRGDLVIDFKSLCRIQICPVFSLIDSGGYLDSLYIGKKDVMFLRDFLLIRIGQSIMLTGYGYHAHHSFTRSEKTVTISSYPW